MAFQPPKKKIAKGFAVPTRPGDGSGDGLQIVGKEPPLVKKKESTKSSKEKPAFSKPSNIVPPVGEKIKQEKKQKKVKEKKVKKEPQADETGEKKKVKKRKKSESDENAKPKEKKKRVKKTKEDKENILEAAVPSLSKVKNVPEREEIRVEVEVHAAKEDDTVHEGKGEDDIEIDAVKEEDAVGERVGEDKVEVLEAKKEEICQEGKVNAEEEEDHFEDLLNDLEELEDEVDNQSNHEGEADENGVVLDIDLEALPNDIRLEVLKQTNELTPTATWRNSQERPDETPSKSKMKEHKGSMSKIHSIQPRQLLFVDKEELKIATDKKEKLKKKKKKVSTSESCDAEPCGVANGDEDVDVFGPLQSQERTIDVDSFGKDAEKKIKKKKKKVKKLKKVTSEIERLEKETGVHRMSQKSETLSPLEQLEAELLEAEIEEQGTWVQCDNRWCRKWRLLTHLQDPSELPERWMCSMNPDDNFNSCDIPEQSWDKTNEDGFVYTEFSEGSIVWARMVGYPWWPAMVQSDPDLRTFYEADDLNPMMPVYYHVVFLDKKQSRAWVRRASIKPFNCHQEEELLANPVMAKGLAFKKQRDFALQQALSAVGMTLEEKIKNFGFNKKKFGKLNKDSFVDTRQSMSDDDDFVVASTKWQGPAKKRKVTDGTTDEVKCVAKSSKSVKKKKEKSVERKLEKKNKVCGEKKKIKKKKTRNDVEKPVRALPDTPKCRSNSQKRETGEKTDNDIVGEELCEEGQVEDVIGKGDSDCGEVNNTGSGYHADQKDVVCCDGDDERDDDIEHKNLAKYGLGGIEKNVAKVGSVRNDIGLDAITDDAGSKKVDVGDCGDQKTQEYEMVVPDKEMGKKKSNSKKVLEGKDDKKIGKKSKTKEVQDGDKGKTVKKGTKGKKKEKDGVEESKKVVDGHEDGKEKKNRIRKKKAVVVKNDESGLCENLKDNGTKVEVKNAETKVCEDLKADEAKEVKDEVKNCCGPSSMEVAPQKSENNEGANDEPATAVPTGESIGKKVEHKKGEKTKPKKKMDGEKVVKKKKAKQVDEEVKTKKRSKSESETEGKQKKLKKKDVKGVTEEPVEKSSEKNVKQEETSRNVGIADSMEKEAIKDGVVHSEFEVSNVGDNSSNAKVKENKGLASKSVEKVRKSPARHAKKPKVNDSSQGTTAGNKIFSPKQKVAVKTSEKKTGGPMDRFLVKPKSKFTAPIVNKPADKVGTAMPAETTKSEKAAKSPKLSLKRATESTERQTRSSQKNDSQDSQVSEVDSQELDLDIWSSQKSSKRGTERQTRSSQKNDTQGSQVFNVDSQELDLDLGSSQRSSKRSKPKRKSVESQRKCSQKMEIATQGSMASEDDSQVLDLEVDVPKESKQAITPDERSDSPVMEFDDTDFGKEDSAMDGLRDVSPGFEIGKDNSQDMDFDASPAMSVDDDESGAVDFDVESQSKFLGNSESQSQKFVNEV